MSGWEEHWDEGHARKYWHNERTGETTWTPPAEHAAPRAPPPPPAAAAEWKEFWDEGNRRKYWHNQRTGETTWEQPAATQGGGKGYGDDGKGQGGKGDGAGPPRKWAPDERQAQVAVRQAAEQAGDDERVGCTVVEWREERGFGFVVDEQQRRAYMHHSAFGGGQVALNEKLTAVYQPDPRNPGKFTAMRVQRGELATVVDWNPKGFGFVTFSGGIRAYIHHSTFGKGDLMVGEKLTATPAPDPRNPGKYSAQNVQRHSAAQQQQLIGGRAPVPQIAAPPHSQRPY